MKIMLFARLRELHGDDSVAIDDGECPASVGELRTLLRERAGGDLAEALADPNVFCAVNQRVVDELYPLTAADEVAFFPPMTGG